MKPIFKKLSLIIQRNGRYMADPQQARYVEKKTFSEWRSLPSMQIFSLCVRQLITFSLGEVAPRAKFRVNRLNNSK